MMLYLSNAPLNIGPINKLAVTCLLGPYAQKSYTRSKVNPGLSGIHFH